MSTGSPSQTEAELYLLDNQLSAADNGASSRTSSAQVAKLEQPPHALRVRAPIYKLPDELLSIIFLMHAITPEGLDCKLSLKLSWVVSRWRRVALNTSALWTTLRLFYPASATTRDRCHAFLDRSATRSIRLEVMMPAEQDMVFDFEDVNVDGLQLLTRCDTLEIFNRDHAPSNYYISTPNFPSTVVLPLTRLIIHVAIVTDIFSLLGICPCLRRLELWDANIPERSPFALHEIELPLLSHIIASMLDLPAMLKGLILPELHTATLTDCQCDLTQPDISINLSSVTALNVQADMHYDVSCGILIQTICGMPALRTFSMSLFMEDDLSEVPKHLKIPPLEQIDFKDSRNVDQLARCLVERTTGEGTVNGSLQEVSAESDGDQSWRQISEDVLEFIHDRVPRVRFTCKRK